MKINLWKCRTGQQVVLNDNTILVYLGIDHQNEDYPHILIDPESNEMVVRKANGDSGLANVGRDVNEVLDDMWTGDLTSFTEKLVSFDRKNEYSPSFREY